MSKYGVFSSPYFPAFGLNTERYSVFSRNAREYGPEKTPYLYTFHAVIARMNESAHLPRIKQEYQECLIQRKIHNQ